MLSYSKTKGLIAGLLLTLMLSLMWWQYSAPVNQDDICLLFQQRPSWYQATLTSQQRWGIPISIQMAIIHRESHFRAGAKPPFRLLLGFIPWARKSSAQGYMQALDQTWQNYMRATKQHRASRTDFYHATDFIGWYLGRAHRVLGVSKSDAYRLYLIYHEGMGGYQRKTYMQQPTIQKVARQVANQSAIYQKQLMICRRSLRSL